MITCSGTASSTTPSIIRPSRASTARRKYYATGTSESLRSIAGYEAGWGEPSDDDRRALVALMQQLGEEDAPPSEIPSGESGMEH